ncbi:MAG: hypothetical protein JWN86_4097 [Planctomycetota bacterium]|nr:hypothetical protein [Planctomycetota bacterium]
MKRITLYRHKDCARCAKIARVHHVFDWLNRVETSTETPPTGPLRMGEIAVHDHRTGTILKGVGAVRKIAMQIPAYWPLLPLLWIPPLARRIDHEVRGCDDGSCGVPQTSPEKETAGRS